MVPPNEFEMMQNIGKLRSDLHEAQKQLNNQQILTNITLMKWYEFNKLSHELESSLINLKSWLNNEKISPVNQKVRINIYLT